MGYETSRSRRAFIRNMGALLASGASAAFIPQLNVISRALASGKSLAAGPYRALVCVYLGGGNDGFNLLVPMDVTGVQSGPYFDYKNARSGIWDSAALPGGLAIPRDATMQTATTMLPLLPLTLAAGNGSYGVNPYCPELKAMFDAQKLAFVANVGTLVQPLTKEQYTGNTGPKPFQLYSHSDQTNLWQLGRSDPQYQFGWGGHAASFVQSLNDGNLIPGLSPCISLQGSNRFEIGPGVVPYQMTSSGATQLNNYSSPSTYSNAIKSSLNELLALEYESLYASEYSGTLSRSIDLATDLSGYLAGTALNPDPFFGISGNSLADQLKMVARMIKVCSDRGIQRQVYFVQLGGFDTHAAQISLAQGGGPGGGSQGLLLQRLSIALNAFQNALASPQIALENNVVTFTMSEFSRTLSSNGSGTDHAWGGIQLVMGNTDTLGGPLAGGRVYGTYPNIVLNGANSLDRGQMIPDWSVEQMMAPMAAWMGVQPGDLNTVFPNLSNFSGNLSFLA